MNEFSTLQTNNIHKIPWTRGCKARRRISHEAKAPMRKNGCLPKQEIDRQKGDQFNEL